MLLLSGPARRDRAAEADGTERLRSVRERLEATVSGLMELEYMRQRQEGLVQTALKFRGSDPHLQEERWKEAPLSSKEKLLEENILLLRKQLNCLRKRDAGLISQLQELDRQISDLQLDTEGSHDQLEMDSRPSSGFYELSDGASGSLSNSSNSVFSECLFSMVDADARLSSTDEQADCLECDRLLGGLCEEVSSSGTVRRSLSAPNPPTVDAASSSDIQSKYLQARKCNDVYPYLSPLHAVAIQSPTFTQMLGYGGHDRDEAETSAPPITVSAPHVPQSSSWPASSFSSSTQTISHKRLDGYIYTLLQRRAQPVRTSKPRTSISTDPSKSILRQANLCVRQVSCPSPSSGLGALRGPDMKPSWLAGGISADNVPTLSPQRQQSVESKGDEEEMQNILSVDSSDFMQNGLKSSNIDSSSPGCSVTKCDNNTSTNSLRKKNKRFISHSLLSTANLSKDFGEMGSPKSNSSPRQNKELCCSPDQDLLLKSPPVLKTQTGAPKNFLKGPQIDPSEESDVLIQGPDRKGFSSKTQDKRGGNSGGDHRINNIHTKQHSVIHRKSGSKNVKTVKVKSTSSGKTSRACKHGELLSEIRVDRSHHRSSSKQSQEEDFTYIKISKRGVSSRVKRLPASIPEGRVLDKHASSMLSSVRSGLSKNHHHGNHYIGTHHHHHHHHHGRDQVVVVAKPKYKRNDYRRLRAIMEVTNDEAFRRIQRRQRRELLSNSAAKVYPTCKDPVMSPYSFTAGSDSEYSAECASLFHSTIVDSSEDERSNYTTNCFGDSESSDEYVEESTTTSDTEESGGGGMGRGWGHFGGSGAKATGQEMTQAQAKACIKIKASRNLKKKILRFRSGSLKLMTTV
ncbi:dapper homolog 1 [Pholidichthys leucotaenia]